MHEEYTAVKGGVCAPEGFQAAAVGCGIKDPSKLRLDLAMIYCPQPTVAVAAFTQSRVKAAPVRLSLYHFKRTKDVRAVILNSGNANACTGPQGMDDARAMSRAMAKKLGLRMGQTAVCSTGIIGMPLPIDRILPRIPELAGGLALDRSDDVAQAIMTSDTRPKSVAVTFTLGGKKVTVGGIAKGAGMIRPNMATMLAVLTTDAAVEPGCLQRIFSQSVDQSFNCVTVDGDTSTNDTVILISNGLACNPVVKWGTEDAAHLAGAVSRVMLELAKLIVGDGERITKVVTIHVRGAGSMADARKAADAVANSTLVKCSWNGSDPNWGRVMHALGYSGAKMREEYVDIYFDGLLACKNGLTAPTALEDLTNAVKRREFTVTVDLNLGVANHTVYTTDLSPNYVEFNSSEYAAAKMKAGLR